MSSPWEDDSHREIELRRIGEALGAGQCLPTAGQGGTTSNMSIDEILLLHSTGLEPAKVAVGTGSVSVVAGAWVWGTGPVYDGHDAFDKAFDVAKESLRQTARSVPAIGVLGVEIDVQMAPYHCTVVMTGTAVRPLRDHSGQAPFAISYKAPFLCDLSARDFSLLTAAGWYPKDLVAGSAYVHAPRRGMGAVGQLTQNVELGNYTQTLYAAREAAMKELESRLPLADATGLLDVKLIDRPLPFAHHVVEFVAYGTAVRLVAAEHVHPRPALVVPLDDRQRTFEATSLD